MGSALLSPPILWVSHIKKSLNGSVRFLCVCLRPLTYGGIETNCFVEIPFHTMMIHHEIECYSDSIVLFMVSISLSTRIECRNFSI